MPIPSFAPETTPNITSSPIKVIGVGGGGSNAVNTMFQRGIPGVDFVVCNTDSQALESSPVLTKVQLGATLTKGRGAGSVPEVGRNAAIESLDEVTALLQGETSMVFITAGMGGGTGTGAGPVIARAAKELGILTVGIVTVPFQFEGRRRADQANSGLEEMRDAVDTLLIIRNDKIRELYGNLTLRKAFANADNVLCTAAKGIAEVITLTGDINVDMNDVNTVMKNSGRAIMGSGQASGEGRARTAVSEALESPLLSDFDITGANFVLLNITFGTEEILMDEIMEITDFIQDAAGQSAEVIWGYGVDEELAEDLSVTVIATGFSGLDRERLDPQGERVTKKHDLEDARPQEITQPIVSATKAGENSGTDSADQASAIPDLSDSDGPLDDPKSPFDKLTVRMVPTTPGDLFTSVPETAATADPNNVSQPPSAPINEDPINPFTPPHEIEKQSLPFDLTQEDAFSTPEEDKGEEKEEEKEGFTFHTLEDAEEDEVKSVAPEISNPAFATTPPEPQKTPAPKEALAQGATTETTRAQSGTKPHSDFVARIQHYTRRLKTPGGLADLEDEPAYKRRKIKIDETPHSSESQVSRFSLTETKDEDGERQVELRDDNSFLTDNVD